MNLDAARRIADTVLYEGYILYPYRASHGKNGAGVRWQFGVLVPQRHADANPLPPGAMQAAGTVSGAVETWCQQTECILEPADGDARSTSGSASSTSRPGSSSRPTPTGPSPRWSPWPPGASST